MFASICSTCFIVARCLRWGRQQQAGGQLREKVVQGGIIGLQYAGNAGRKNGHFNARVGHERRNNGNPNAPR